jgi:hypothetical protein
MYVGVNDRRNQMKKLTQQQQLGGQKSDCFWGTFWFFFLSF